MANLESLTSRSNQVSGWIGDANFPCADSKPRSHAVMGDTYTGTASEKAASIAATAASERYSFSVTQIAAQVSSSSI